MISNSIVWSPNAKITYFKVIEYLYEKWTIREVDIFVNRVDEILGYISSNQLLYPYSKESGTHKCVVVKQVSLFYKIKNNTVELVIFWDNRQDPKKLILL